MTIEAILDVLKENHLDTPGNLAKLTARINDSKDPNKGLLIDNVFKALIFLKQQDSLTEKNLDHIFTLLEPKDGSSLANWLELAEPYFFLVTSPRYGFKTTHAIDESLTQLIKLVTFNYADKKKIWFKFLSSYIQDSIRDEVKDKALHILSILVINETIQQPDFVNKTKVIKKLLESLLDNSRSDIKAKIDIAKALDMITDYFYEGNVVDARIMAIFKNTQTRIALIELFKYTQFPDLKFNVLAILYNILYNVCADTTLEACAPDSKMMTEAGIIPSLIDYLQTDESLHSGACSMIAMLVVENIDAVKQMESLGITRILISSIRIHRSQILEPLKSLSDMQLEYKQLPEQIIADQVLPKLAQLIKLNEQEEEVDCWAGEMSPTEYQFMFSCIGNYIKSNSVIILDSIKSQGVLKLFLDNVIDDEGEDGNQWNNFNCYVHPYEMLKCLAYDVECHKALEESGSIEYLFDKSNDSDDPLPLAILRMISRRKVETTVQILSIVNPFKHLGPDVQSEIASMTGMPEIDTPESVFCSAESHLKLIGPLLYPTTYYNKSRLFTEYSGEQNNGRLDVEGQPAKRQRLV